MNKSTPAMLAAAVVTAAAALVLRNQNSRVEVETVPVRLDGLPPAMAGLRIAHLSDLHIPHCVLLPERLAALVAVRRPDLIVITGDMVYCLGELDGRGVTRTVRLLAGIAPVFASVGNHEWYHEQYADWLRLARAAGATVLNDRGVALEIRGGKLALYGLTHGTVRPALNDGAVRVALAHYPHRLGRYAADGYDLVLAGHAHGGQARLCGRGLFARGQGLLPRYTSGLYRMAGTQMVVSRGLSRIPLLVRVNNPPHLPVVVLESGAGGR